MVVDRWRSPKKCATRDDEAQAEDVEDRQGHGEPACAIGTGIDETPNVLIQWRPPEPALHDVLGPLDPWMTGK